MSVPYEQVFYGSWCSQSGSVSTVSCAYQWSLEYWSIATIGQDIPKVWDYLLISRTASMSSNTVIYRGVISIAFEPTILRVWFYIRLNKLNLVFKSELVLNCQSHLAVYITWTIGLWALWQCPAVRTYLLLMRAPPQAQRTPPRPFEIPMPAANG